MYSDPDQCLLKFRGRLLLNQPDRVLTTPVLLFKPVHVCLSLYTEESCAKVARTLNPSLPCLLFILFLCTSRREKAEWNTGNTMLPLNRTIGSALGLLHKSWDWEGNEEGTGSQHSSVSFGTIQFHGFLVTFPSHLKKRMRAPSVLSWEVERNWALPWQSV